MFPPPIRNNMAFLSSLRTLLVLLAMQETAVEAVTLSMDHEDGLQDADKHAPSLAAPQIPTTPNARTADTVLASSDLLNQFLNAASFCSATVNFRREVNWGDSATFVMGGGYGPNATLEEAATQELMVAFVLAILRGVEAGMAYEDDLAPAARGEEPDQPAASKFVAHGRTLDGFPTTVDLRAEVPELVAAFSKTGEAQRHFRRHLGPFRDADDSVWRRIGNIWTHRNYLLREHWDRTQQPDRLAIEFSEMIRGCLDLLRDEDEGDGGGIRGASAYAFHQSWAAVGALMPAVRDMLEVAAGAEKPPRSRMLEVAAKKASSLL